MYFENVQVQVRSVTMSDVTHVPVSCEPRPQVTPAHLVTSWHPPMSRSSVKHPMAVTSVTSPDSPAPQLPPMSQVTSHVITSLSRSYLTRTEATSSTGAFDRDTRDNCLLDNFQFYR